MKSNISKFEREYLEEEAERADKSEQRMGLRVEEAQVDGVHTWMGGVLPSRQYETLP